MKRFLSKTIKKNVLTSNSWRVVCMVWELCSEKNQNQNYFKNYNHLHEVHPGKFSNSTEELYIYVLTEASGNVWSVFNSISLSSLHIHNKISVVIVPLIVALSWKRKSNNGSHLQPAHSTPGSLWPPAGQSWLYLLYNFSLERAKVCLNLWILKISYNY